MEAKTSFFADWRNCEESSLEKRKKEEQLPAEGEPRTFESPKESTKRVLLRYLGKKKKRKDTQRWGDGKKREEGKSDLTRLFRKKKERLPGVPRRSRKKSRNNV